MLSREELVDEREMREKKMEKIELMGGGLYVLKLTRKEKREEKTVWVGEGKVLYGGASERQLRQTTPAPPSFDTLARKIFALALALSFHGGAGRCCCLDCARPMIRRYAPKKSFTYFTYFTYGYSVVLRSPLRLTPDRPFPSTKYARCE